MGDRVYERVLAYAWRRFHVRVWVQRDRKDHEGLDEKLHGTLANVCVALGVGRPDLEGYETDPTWEQLDAIALAIADCDSRVNAVEAKGPDGDGSLVYNDWP